MFSRALIQDSPLSIKHFVSVLSDFIHVDDFRGFPQILQLRICQRLHPILFRLFAELSGLSRYRLFLFRQRRIWLRWRLLSSSLLGRIHIDRHGTSDVISVQFPPHPRTKSIEQHDAEKVRQHRSHLESILNVAQRLRLRCFHRLRPC